MWNTDINNMIVRSNGPAAAATPTMVENAVLQPISEIAKPLHLQRLESALDMRPFMSYAHKMLSKPLTSSESDNSNSSNNDDDDDDFGGGAKSKRRRNGSLGTKQERQNVKAHIYNFVTLTSDREWLYDVILSDTETESEFSDEDDYVKDMLKTHIREQKYRETFYKVPTNTQYGYYSAGFLSMYDMFPDHQRSIVGVRKRRREREKKEKPPKKQKMPKMAKVKKMKNLDRPEPGEINPADLKHYAWGETSAGCGAGDDADADGDVDSLNRLNHPPFGAVMHSGRGRRRKSLLPKTPEVMAARRRKVWQLMAKKELGKYQRAKVNNHKEILQGCKRLASMCMKVSRHRAMQSQKIMKETIWRAKRLTREMQGYWKRYDRVERETRRRMEKEAEEQRKIDVEIIEAKRQQRKLNFLITQTELYAHFMSKKLGHGTEEEQLRILSQLDEELNPRLAAFDDYDPDYMKQLAQQNAEDAFHTDSVKTRQFEVTASYKEEEQEDADDRAEDEDIKPIKPDLPQPQMFRGTLKTYQLKGMTWLANLYDQGISGILADEMGLGKTVQSIAFLCHIAEKYGLWGPFLIISPASTLHNWQQEMQRFVPDFLVVPYWGSPTERRILRQFWEQKDLHTKDARFHVVITSYQLVVSDYKYFNRIKWQYMILDEAQAIKSSSSMRWKLLLGFNCRNRLLLSGTPIQNSMAELWALLHFIMPTLFDSHDEFNEWFSKDIESHAENKTGIDERQISRLHMILKPFMLRRIKKDVENELSDKIEIMVYCPLTIRQKLLYMALKKKIRIEDLLHFSGGGSSDGHIVDRNFTSNLMNLVMQFRKVCNHPELFERRDAKSPFSMRCEEYVIARLIFDEGILTSAMPSRKHLLYNRFSIFKAEAIQRSIFFENSAKPRKPGDDYPRYIDLSVSGGSCFSFSRFCDTSPIDLEDITLGGLIKCLKKYREKIAFYQLLMYCYQWWSHYSPTRFMLLEPYLKNLFLIHCVLKKFIFTGVTSPESSVYTFGDYQTVNMQETIEHRVIRSKNARKDQSMSDMIVTNPGNNDIEEFEKSEIKTELELDVCSIPDDNSSGKAPTRGRPPKNAEKCLKSHITTVLLPKFSHKPLSPTKYVCEPIDMPRFLYGLGQKVQAVKRRFYCESRAAEWAYIHHAQCDNREGQQLVYDSLELCKPRYGWSSIVIPDKQTLVSDAGKLAVLDNLLTRLKSEGHRVLIYSQMTKMIDLLEEYMWHRRHRYMRLDGSSKISARRDMVADFQSRADIFVFLLSTRAGGLGINLTAADTVIFYDSDWNPTVDQQAMDRAHRLGQTKQVTVYRLICKGTIEERILQRAREKSEIQRMVISGGNFKPDTLKPKEVVSLLLDDEEIELKYRQKNDEKVDEPSTSASAEAALSDKKRRDKKIQVIPTVTAASISSGSSSNSGQERNTPPTSGIIAEKRQKLDFNDDDSTTLLDVGETTSPTNEKCVSQCINPEQTTAPMVPGAMTFVRNDDSSNEALIVDCDSPLRGTDSPGLFNHYGSLSRPRRRHHPRGTKRGRPRGSRRGGGNGSLSKSLPASLPSSSISQSSAVTRAATPTAAAAAAAAATTTATTTTTLRTVTNTSPTVSGNDNNSSGTSPTVVVTGTLTNMGEGVFSPTVPPPVKRGPGRPRLKPGGPPHQGTRGTPRTRKPIGPLVVPLGQSPAATPINRSPVISPTPSPAHSTERANTIGYYPPTDNDL